MQILENCSVSDSIRRLLNQMQNLEMAIYSEVGSILH